MVSEASDHGCFSPCACGGMVHHGRSTWFEEVCLPQGSLEAKEERGRDQVTNILFKGMLPITFVPLGSPPKDFITF